MYGYRSLEQAFRWRLVAATLLWMIVAVPGTVWAQELVPRAYWPTPNGTNALVLSYQRSTGDIVTDPSLPITGVDSDIDYLQISYQRTFNLAGRTAAMQLSLPYSWGETTGFLGGELHSREITGVGDARVRLSYNIKGAPSMNVNEFRALRDAPHTIVGTSLIIQAPSGEYEADKVINVGTNRWAVKPAIGVIWPMRPMWLLEFELGAWFFGDNKDFLGETREQDPILSTEFHLVRRIRQGLWASLDANFYFGGRTIIAGEEQANLQRNSRIGATVVYPLARGHAIRGSYSTGVVAETGGDFEMLTLSYLYIW
jgi:hypothetical protein